MLLSINDLVDPDFSTYNQLLQLDETFLNQDEIFLTVYRSDNKSLNKKEICNVSKWIFDTAHKSSENIRAIASPLSLLWPLETTSTFKLIPILEPDCTQFTTDDKEKIKKGFEQLKSSPWHGTLVSENSNDLGILIYPTARSDSEFVGNFDHRVVDNLKSTFHETVGIHSPDLKTSWIGDGIFQYYLKKGYEAMPLVNLLMSLLIIVLFKLFLGTFSSSLIFLTAMTWISIPMYAGMALLGHPIDVLTSSLSLMIFVASLEDFLFLTHLSRKYGLRKSFRKILLPSFFTSLTTVIGFGSLLLSDLEIIRRFGLWAAAAAAIEWIVFFLILPALITIYPKLCNWGKPTKLYEKIAATNLAAHGRLLKYSAIIALIAYPLAFLSSKNLYVSDSPERLLEESHPTRKALDQIEDSRGWRATVSLVFPDSNQREFNKKIIEEVQKWPLVDQVEDIYQVKDFLNQDITQQTSHIMDELLQRGTVTHRLGPVDDMIRAIVYVKNLDIVDINKMRRDTKKLCPNKECWLAGTLVSYGELGERVLTTLYKSLGGSLFLVVLVIGFLSLALNPKAFFPLILSGMWGPAALLSCFYIFDIPVFYVTSMIASIVVGLAGDNAIQFLFFSDSKSKAGLANGITHVGPASLFIALCMALASSVFYFGYFDPMKKLAVMMVTGFLLSVIGDIWILKGLMPLPYTNKSESTKN